MLPAKPNNTGGLFALMTILGVTSITMLPVALELVCDLTRNADGSSSLLWFGANLFAIVFILGISSVMLYHYSRTDCSLVQGALRADDSADPPLNMRRALIFNGTFLMIVSATVFLLKGKQARKDLDESKLKESRDALANLQPIIA